MRRTLLILVLLLAGCFILALRLERSLQLWAKDMPQKGSLMEVILGDSRRLLGDYFFAKADIYFHSGYYQSRFGQKEKKREGAGHMAGGTDEHDHDHHGEHDEEEQEAAATPSRDWIEAFGRKFYPTTHSHLDENGTGEKGDGVEEILPWLKFSADLDPNRIETYTVSAYWLTHRLNRPKEAEAFLREGLQANPGNPAILFELSRIAANYEKNVNHAINLLELALIGWKKLEAPKEEPDDLLLEQIYGNLAKLEEERGDYRNAIAYLNEVKKLSPHPEAIQKQIDALQQQELISPPRNEPHEH